MKITIAQSAGFCFGVKQAIKIALDTTQKHTRVEMLGDIVHNETVVEQIEKTGIKKVACLSAGEGKTLLIRAHGAARGTLKEAQRLGYTVVDATCPMVKEIHEIVVNMEQKGYTIIVIGDTEHDEVQGIIGHLQSKALIIDKPENIHLSTINKTKRAAVVVQSTQSLENVNLILNVLKTHIPNLEFHNTICKATRDRQNEIKSLPLCNDIILIIGSKTSANTKRLYELSHALNKNSYWIQTKNNIRPEWLQSATTIGITAGASTPQASIEEVYDYLQTFS